MQVVSFLSYSTACFVSGGKHDQAFDRDGKKVREKVQSNNEKEKKVIFVCL